MEMHMKTWEMILSTLTNTSLTASKLQVSLNNIQSQLKLEKISSLAKDNKIKSLEELVMRIGYVTTNLKEIEELLKKKNVDITSLRNKPKLPATKDSQAKEVAEIEG
jgi:rRNA-processing protein FCF1